MESRSLDGAARPQSDGQPPSAGAELASAQPQNTTAAQQQRATYGQPTRKQTRCRFFGTRKGCRGGNACPYLHEASARDRIDPSLESSTAQNGKNQADGASQSAVPPGDGTAAAKGPADSSVVGLPERSRGPRSTVVQKPVSKTEKQNPREFQINQLRRRFHPKEENDSSGTTVSFGMAPSDPDFPFDMAELQCTLHVPLSYPSSGRPTLRVTNPEMERGFQINVEKGFDDLVETSFRNNRPGSLLGWMNALDRQLERLLTTERAQTIKIIPNAGNRGLPKSNDVNPGSTSKNPSRPVESTLRVEERPIINPLVPNLSKTYTIEERTDAEKRRNDETRQLEARLRRLPLFRKSPDGLSFIVPMQPSKPHLLPLPLRSIKTIKLTVPQLYPLEECGIEVQGVEGTEGRALEAGFGRWTRENPHLNLMSQVNYLVHNMHVLVKKAAEELPTSTPQKTPPLTADTKTLSHQSSSAELAPVKELEDRSHVKIIPRPPEWSHPDIGSDSDTSTDYDSDDVSATDDEEGGAPVPEAPATSATSRGVAVSFPSLELYGIEILELKNLNISVKCERCKDIMDVKNVRAANDLSSASSPVRVESCKKCSNYLSIGFRRELMHGSSSRAGYLDLEGCTVVDLLPSNFLPTCSECSTTFPEPGNVAVRGESATATCRECHRKMVFKIPEIKFLVVGTATVTTRHALPRKKRKEALGITAGQELPRRGRCEHYAKSYRWFRFSCCAKVFPCDKCHDAATDHPNEHANRMICGFCSREQTYRPEDCGICHSILVGKAGSGFWEGGKGTRDKVRMSRKDPRKYKRRGGTAVSSKKK